jgi:hypothetical protein
VSDASHGTAPDPLFACKSNNKRQFDENASVAPG